MQLTLELQRNWAHSFTQSQEDNPTKRHYQDLGHDNALTMFLLYHSLKRIIPPRDTTKKHHQELEHDNVFTVLP
ncbi:8844_t:CDS:2 [Funneliformis geosporum]|uniref:8844_t:CDS:1 n=1 Tax=Funneliformis geosporum TaxID=1117311 RepID=A0A9W4SHF0_9GLOM|nr:8844_t:CDS:2 [Funneliformis geosporum]